METTKELAERSSKPFRAYMLRTCAADMTAHGGFVWPKEGEVCAPDWRPDARCGNGLHGLLWGEGDGSLLNWSADAVHIPNIHLPARFWHKLQNI